MLPDGGSSGPAAAPQPTRGGPRPSLAGAVHILVLPVVALFGVQRLFADLKQALGEFEEVIGLLAQVAGPLTRGRGVFRFLLELFGLVALVGYGQNFERGEQRFSAG